jgi:hypothetical protein
MLVLTSLRANPPGHRLLLPRHSDLAHAADFLQQAVPTITAPAPSQDADDVERAVCVPGVYQTGVFKLAF